MRDAIVILGGAFNPVHTQHISLLCLAKQELEANHQWNIIGGYFAVAPDNYVRHKLQSKNQPTIKLKHRLELIHEGIKDIPWLINSPYQQEMLRQHDGSAFALSQRIKSFLKKDQIQVLILIGGDRMLKHNIPIWRKASSPSKQTPIIRVGIGRILNDESHINLLALWEQDRRQNLIPNPDEFILLDVPTRSVSSSLVRTYLIEWFNSNDDPVKQNEIENNLVNINSYLHSSLMNYIKTHQDDLYIDM